MTNHKTSPGGRPAGSTGHPTGPAPGQIIELAISDLGSEGQGVGRKDGLVVFVAGALPGETVSARVRKGSSAHRGFVQADLTEILEPAAERVEPACPVAATCGGCDLLALAYPAQLAWKTRVVHEAFRRVGHLGDVPVKDCLGSPNPFNYRNKAQFPVVAAFRPDGSRSPGAGGIGAGSRDDRAISGHGRRPGARDLRGPRARRASRQPYAGLVAGLYRRGSHEVVPVETCLLQRPVNNRILSAAVRLAAELKIPAYDEDSGEGSLRHILARVSTDGGQAMAVFVTAQAVFPMGRRLATALREEVPEVSTVVQNVNTRRTNVILGTRDIVLAGPGYITDRLGGLRFRVSASSFFQVNPEQAEVLYQTAASYAAGARRAADVYCGVGTITLYLATRLDRLEEIAGVESNPAAARDAAANARTNHVDKATFICGDAAAVLTDMAGAGVVLDTVVLDPPRKGCDVPVLEALERLAPSRLVYVSCDPATLARDLGILVKGGFRVREAQPVDMFPQTTHVETVVLMSRVEK